MRVRVEKEKWSPRYLKERFGHSLEVVIVLLVLVLVPCPVVVL